jgi:hypothetical protein
MVLYILIFKFFDSRREDRRVWTESSIASYDSKSAPKMWILRYLAYRSTTRSLPMENRKCGSYNRHYRCFHTVKERTRLHLRGHFNRRQ